jgi:dGTP triphosphohydrolase
VGFEKWKIEGSDFSLESRKKDTRTWFQRDIDQITHSIAFRKLQYKSQLLSEKDPISRSRLIHTLEASRIATEISSRLGLNRDLTEAIMLGHDIASSPYGSVGNKFLTGKVPSFNHELAGAIMLLTLSKEKLQDDSEKRAEILEKINKESAESPFFSAKVQGDILGSVYPLYASGKKVEQEGDIKDIYFYAMAPEVIDGVLYHGNSYNTKEPNTLEGQVVKFSDNIAYITQDIDDLLRAEIITENELLQARSPLDWDKIDSGYPDNQKLKNTFIRTRGKKIAAFIERYVGQNEQQCDNLEQISSPFFIKDKIPVLKCDDGLQEVINAFWKFIEGHYKKSSIKTSDSIQEKKLEQLWEILNEGKIDPYKKFIGNCCLDSRFSQYSNKPGWLCAYFISHLSWYEVDLIIDSYHRRDYSFDIDIDWDHTE